MTTFKTLVLIISFGHFKIVQRLYLCGDTDLSEPGLDEAELQLLPLESLDDALEGLRDRLRDRLDPDWDREWEPDSLPDLCRNRTRVITSPSRL